MGGGGVDLIKQSNFQVIFLNKRFICFCEYNICNYGDLDKVTLRIMMSLLYVRRNIEVVLFREGMLEYILLLVIKVRCFFL